jgi:hypothetical protein
MQTPEEHTCVGLGQAPPSSEHVHAPLPVVVGHSAVLAAHVATGASPEHV